MAVVSGIIVGTIATGLAVDQINKGSSALKRFTPAGFESPGLSGSFNRSTNSFDLRRTAEGEQSLADLRGGFEGLAGEVRGLRGDVKPGFGRLTRSRVEAIRAAGSRTVGNLREELGRRRVLGSTFASREIASTEAEFGRLEESARAEAFLQELDLTRQLISDEFRATIGGLAAVLDQLNFESSLAAELANSASQQNQATAVARAELHSAAAAGFFDLAGVGFGAAAGAASDRRLKTNIVRVGTVNGFPWYEFDYTWGEHATGVMSDEVPPECVTQVGGYDYVDYNKVLNYA